MPNKPPLDALPRIRPRVYLAPGCGIGPGKIDLLRKVAETASISAAARALGMSYKRAWQLIEEINIGLGCPAVTTAIGGRGGGGARLSEAGASLVSHYSNLEAEINKVARPHLEAIMAIGRNGSSHGPS